MTDDRSGMLQSPAYLATTPVGRRVLRLIEDTINRSDVSAVTLSRSSFGGHRGSISFGIKQCERLGFVSIGIGLRRANAFSLLDDWRAVDAARRRGGCSWQSCRSRRDRHARCPRSRRSRSSHRSRWRSRGLHRNVR